MIKLTLKEIVAVLRGRPRGDLQTLAVSGVSTDSRAVAPGELFFAVRGERFDGHDFVAQALQSGAMAAVVVENRADALMENSRAAGVTTPRIIGVDDPVAALGRLANFHRNQVACQVIAVVGSNGKTTTKAMIDHVLSAKRAGRASPKSFNNAIGVPLTLLSAQAADEYLVVEVGTNARGEIAALAAITQPDMVVLTSIGEEHLEGLGDLHGVAAEECSIFQGLRAGGFAVVNIDMPQVRGHLPAAGATIVKFGLSDAADLRVGDLRYETPWLQFSLNGKFAYRLRLPGAHNATNAAAVVAIARRFGFEHAEIAARLESFVTPPMRNEVLELGSLTVINDAYNSNPRSAIAAVDSLEAFATAGRRVAVVGEMRELGDKSAEMHRLVANRLARSALDLVFLVGPAAELMRDALETNNTTDAAPPRPRFVFCADVADCQAQISAKLRAGDVILLKASRTIGLERLIEPLRDVAAGLRQHAQVG